MIEVLGEIVCFATATVSFVYGTLLGLFSGEKFYYKRKHRIDSKILTSPCRCDFLRMPLFKKSKTLCYRSGLSSVCAFLQH